MGYEANEISGAVNVLQLSALRALQAIVNGIAEQDTMLTPSKTAQISRSMAEAKRSISKAQEHFKKFEAVADARKITTGV